MKNVNKNTKIALSVLYSLNATIWFFLGVSHYFAGKVRFTDLILCPLWTICATITICDLVWNYEE